MISEKTYYELSWFIDGPIALDGAFTDRMKDIIEANYIVPNSYTSDYIESSDEWVVGIAKDWRISDKGLDVLKEFEEDRRRKAAEGKDKRTNRNISVAALIIGILTLAATIFFGLRS